MSEKVINPADFDCWSSDGTDFSHRSLAELIESNDEIEPGRVVHCGHTVMPDPSGWVDADDVCEMLAERAHDNCGSEHTEDFPDVSKEAVAELDAFLSAWITKNCPVTFWGVDGAQQYTVTAEDCATLARAPE